MITAFIRFLSAVHVGSHGVVTRVHDPNQCEIRIRLPVGMVQTNPVDRRQRSGKPSMGQEDTSEATRTSVVAAGSSCEPGSTHTRAAAHQSDARPCGQPIKRTRPSRRPRHAARTTRRRRTPIARTNAGRQAGDLLRVQSRDRLAGVGPYCTTSPPDACTNPHPPSARLRGPHRRARRRHACRHARR